MASASRLFDGGSAQARALSTSIFEIESAKLSGYGVMVLQVLLSSTSRELSLLELPRELTWLLHIINPGY